MTRENLNELIKQIDYAQPSESPLYTMAIQAHGGAKPALTARNAAAIQHLSIWINSIVALRSNLESQANPVQYQSADRIGTSRANQQATQQEKDEPLDALGMDSTRVMLSPRFLTIEPMLSLIRLRFIRLDYRSFITRSTLSSSIVGTDLQKKKMTSP